MAYIISKQQSIFRTSDNVTVAIALSEADLKDFVASRLVLGDVGSNGLKRLTLDGTYFVQEVTVASSVKKTEHDVNMAAHPFECVTVPSQTTRGVFYGVAINDKGYIYACTCPAFKHHSDKACKHMDFVYWNAPFGKTYRVDVNKVGVA